MELLLIGTSKKTGQWFQNDVEFAGVKFLTIKENLFGNKKSEVEAKQKK